jgi:hypothetical protein
MPDKEQIAERILSMFTDREHASCIVGDLAETSAASGGAGFWQSVTATALGLAWRPAALILGCLAMEMLIGATFGLSMNTYQSRSIDPWPKIPAMVLGFSAMLLSVPAVFSSARYGWSDPVARLTVGLTVVGWTGGCLHFVAPVLKVCMATWMTLLIAAMIRRTYRAALVSVAATLFTAGLLFFTIAMLSVRLFFPLSYAIILIAQLWVPSRLRRAFA